MGTMIGNNNMEKIFTALSAKKADLIILILASQDIKTSIKKQNNLFDILVNREDKEKSFLMIDTYYKENKFFRLKQQLLMEETFLKEVLK